MDGSRQRAGHIPIHAVVHNQEIDPGCDRLLEGDEARVDGGPDLGDPAVVATCSPLKAPGASLKAARRVRRSQ